MLPKQEVVAMLLAGGQGSRLGVLTKYLAKPAVPFGGKYRIIDFPLSNCVNSGIDTVGVLTQYQPLVLNRVYRERPALGSGPHNGRRVCAAALSEELLDRDWYTGTANAIYQNIPFIERYDPEYVMILSGDHIYKMDYSGNAAVPSRRRHADCTIAVDQGSDGKKRLALAL